MFHTSKIRVTFGNIQNTYNLYLQKCYTQSKIYVYCSNFIFFNQHNVWSFIKPYDLIDLVFFLSKILAI